ncbi:hypothetical protein GCM10023340_07390 [Nocardioides marinquilinus]|uniref:Carbon monoxide dehydrogenase n=1 Tax=Nocardioides marinquilinus TaxID=1210400 RepID=A0ABP9PG04_9ACTN
MDLTHRFTVPTPVEQTWEAFGDIAALAECFPGATVTEADGESFAGSVKVKLGPIALVYNGSGTFVDKDDASHSFKVDAKGKDKRGNGTAGAKVSLAMSEAEGGGTDVEVLTDLAITGKPAQFGRGVMQDVSDKLLGQFVACLEQRLTADSESESAPAVEEAPEATPIADAAAASSSASSPSAPSSSSSTTPAAAEAADPAPAAAAKPAAAPRPAPRPAASEDVAVDLGAAVVPVLAKAYWKQGLGALAVLAVLWRLLRR